MLCLGAEIRIVGGISVIDYFSLGWAMSGSMTSNWNYSIAVVLSRELADWLRCVSVLGGQWALTTRRLGAQSERRQLQVHSNGLSVMSGGGRRAPSGPIRRP